MNWVRGLQGVMSLVAHMKKLSLTIAREQSSVELYLNMQKVQLLSLSWDSADSFSFSVTHQLFEAMEFRQF